MTARTVLMAALAGAAAGALAPAVAPAAVRQVDVPRLLAPQIDRVTARSPVPVLLPSRMPVDTGVRLHGAGGTNRTGWSTQIAAAPRCGGANVCTLARFEADRMRRPSGDVRVRLARGRVGFFTPLSCGASCAPPIIEWRERGATFSIAAKVGTTRTERGLLVRMANEAITAGPR